MADHPKETPPGPDPDRKSVGQRLTELRRSGAAGKHRDKRTRRRRTRGAHKRAHIQEDT